MRTVIAGALAGAMIVLPAAAQTPPAAQSGGETVRAANLRDASELARICAAEANTITAQYYEYGYCFGFATGALNYHRAITPANAPPLYCAPNPPPSFEQLRGQYVTWVNRSPANGSMRAVDSIFAFLRDSFPCPTPPPTTRRR